jgi:cellulose synthase/poly-beta-1,6-N-acetylglucosamine synthase-like glycosyltransferase
VIDLRGLVLYLANFAVVAVVVGRSITRSNADDRGDGLAVVVLPSPSKPNHLRTGILLGVVGAFVVAYLGFRSPKIEQVYRSLVVAIAKLIIADTPTLARTLRGLGFGLRFLALAYLVGLAVAVRADLGRRLIIAFNMVWLFILFVLTDVAVVIIAALTGLAPGWAGVLRTGLSLIVIVAMDARVLLTTFQLPRPTTLAVERGRPRSDNVVTWTVLVGVTAGGVALAVYAFSPYVPPSLWVLLAGYCVFPVFLISGRLVLAALNAMFHAPPPVTSLRPAIDVIIPAYNEEEGLGDTLLSIDRAAEVYGGPVRVIVADDGSTDRTNDLANRVIAQFRAATGMVVGSGHRGKAWALNTALSYATAGIVIRIDADVVVHEESILHAPSWFDNPAVGSVSAMTLPRHQDTWYAHLRIFEALLEFGLGRRGDQVVDAIGCVPGTYTAFRRQPVMDIGGFVMGMNGEDADLTMQLGRLGYRAVLDPRIRIFEDVPRTFAEFLEQRTRWSRGEAQIFARHLPFRVGFAGPRTWFTLFRVYSRRITSQLRTPLIMLALAASILAPTARRTLAVVITLNVVVIAPIFALFLLLALYHGQLRELRYLPLYFPFQMARRLAKFESTLSLPTRPSPSLPRRGRATEPGRADLVNV